MRRSIILKKIAPSDFLSFTAHLIYYVPPSSIFKEISPSDVLCFSAQPVFCLELGRDLGVGGKRGWVKTVTVFSHPQ